MAGPSQTQSSISHLQAVHNRAAFPAIVFLLPLVHLANELQKGALGHRRVSVHRPAQELELLHHPISILGLENQAVARGVKRKQALFTLLNSSGQVPPTWSSHQSRAILKERLAYK